MNIGHTIPFHVEAMFDYSLTMIQAELAWLEKFIKQMEVQDGKERL